MSRRMRRCRRRWRRPRATADYRSDRRRVVAGTRRPGIRAFGAFRRCVVALLLVAGVGVRATALRGHSR